jgi:hypothetical protein
VDDAPSLAANHAELDVVDPARVVEDGDVIARPSAEHRVELVGLIRREFDDALPQAARRDEEPLHA